ncbi:MAG: iron-containing alcohol dehydrogenase [Rhodobacteraceae bacterium]|nr:MAG: iron-containing alcohol dehydrogenase [Paracoccaceae bacterium]
MSLDIQLSDISRLDRIREVLAANDPRGQFTALGMQDLQIGDDVLDALAGITGHLLVAAGRSDDRTARVVMMADPVVILRGGQPLKPAVMARLDARFTTTAAILDDGHPVLHADEPILAEAAAAAQGADCIVSVGGGTITDIAKVAAERADVPVHIVIQTAASVDGYTDNFAVVLQNGVKKTLPSRWPDAVLTDTRTVADAPLVLNASGFGELLSMYSAPGDWFLSCEMGLDDTFAPVLIELLSRCGDGIAAWSGGIARGDHAACSRLATALALRGIVTGVGGTTASLSGMEHLFSHMLDMVAGEKGTATGLHGAQVGVGSVIRAAAWEEFCARMEEDGLDTARLFPGVESFEPRVRAAFSELDPSGRIGAECWSRYRTKLGLWHANRSRIEAAFANWVALRARHDALGLGSHAIAACLHRAGAATRFSDLEPLVDAELMRWVVANCQFMRERGSVADLLTLAGWWDEAGVARVLARVDAACAAAERGA